MSRKDVPDALVYQAAEQYQRDSTAALLQRRHGEVPMVDAILMEWTGESRKVVERAIKRAALRGVVECGVSLRTCWPKRLPISPDTAAPPR